MVKFTNGLLITSNNSTIYGHKKRLDVIEEDIKTISSNSTEIIDIKNNLSNIENTIKNHNTGIIIILILKMILLMLIQI